MPWVYSVDDDGNGSYSWMDDESMTDWSNVDYSGSPYADSVIKSGPGVDFEIGRAHV